MGLPFEKLLARHFGIDLEEVEREQRALLADQRHLNEEVRESKEIG